MVSKGTTKPYVQFIGAASTGVTQSCHLVRFKKYAILLDCGMYQEGDIATNYRRNRDLLKQIHVKDIDYVILSHCHIDHSGLIPALFAKGCNAHVMVPQGSVPFLKLLWEDSMKIDTQDCLKLQRKHGIKASPMYNTEDIERALFRCIEIPVEQSYRMAEDLALTFYPANHIINACQVYFEMQDGYVKHRLGFTGDIGGNKPQPYVLYRKPLPYVNLLVCENTYNEPKRMNKAYDRVKDLEKMSTVINEAHRILIPCFSLGRTQTVLTELYHLWNEEKLPEDIKIVLDSPLAQKICRLYPHLPEWAYIMNEWSNLHFVNEWTESEALQMGNDKCVVVAASGMMNGGRVVSWAKSILPDVHNHILFCGYSSENTLASQIRSNQAEVVVDGEVVKNKANITELVSFSSHASYEELMKYYGEECRFDKLALVHGEFSSKVSFAHTLQDKLIEQGKSSKVIAVNEDTKIYI